MSIGYKVDIKQKMISCQYDEGDYARWNEVYDNTLNPNLTIDMNYPDVISEIDLRKVKSGYLIWIEWSDGNSFGCAENRNTDCLALVEKENTAIQLRDTIKQLIDDDDTHVCFDENRNIIIDTKEGKIQIGNPEWLWDYFASRKRVHIDLVYLGE